MPSVDPGMNRIGPSNRRGGKGAKGEKEPVALQPGDGKKDKDEAKKQELLTRARKRFERCVSQEADNRKNAVDDLKFKSGEGQWPADVVSQRNFDKRPTLTINKLPTFVNQVVNDQRMNRPAININPVGDRGDPEVAKMYRGLIRAIERHSAADTAYDTAFDSAVSGGFGYWRFMIEYESADSFQKTIVIKRIRNPMTVYLDPSHQEPDGSDARYGFVTETVPRKEFEEDFPDADPMPWNLGGSGEDDKQWVTEHDIRIAEYFEIVTEKRRLVELENGHVGWFDELNDAGKKLEVVNDRWSDFNHTQWYKLTIKDVLEEDEWPGKWVPIVKVTGNEIDIEGKVRLSGIIRNAKSSQLMYNYMRTTGVEIAMLQPKAPWVGAEGQFEGYENDWKQSNTKPTPYLEYRPVDVEGKPAPPPQRQQFQGVNQNVMAEVQAAAQDLQGTTGIRFDATMNERTYDESGRALRELRERGDLGSFHYVDNLARSLRHGGEILVDLIPKVFDTKQIVTILREDDSEEQVQIDPNAPKPSSEGQHPQTHKKLNIFNPTYGKYGVTVTIGPSYATKRIEASESIMGFMRALGPAAPQAIPLIMDLVAKNQDWPESQQISKRLASLVPPQVLAADIKDVPPQLQALLAQMQQQLQAAAAEKAQLVKALTEQQSDRAQRQDEIDKSFEAKLLNTMATFEAKMAAIQQKSEDSTIDRVMAPIQELAAGVQELRGALETPPVEGARRAPDGNYYLPDPDREGKWLMVAAEGRANGAANPS